MSQTSNRMNKRQSVTIKDVAERAGVSLMTVSRVLNKQSVVREETRKRVEAAIKELNYRPNMLARNLAGGKALFIGLVHANPSDGYLSEFLVGALNTCRSAGHHLVLEDLTEEDGGLPETSEIERRLQGAGLDGVIVTPPLSEEAVIVETLRRLSIPFVRIAYADPESPDLGVAIDDEAAAASMTRYLIAKGHKHIGFILGARNQSYSQARLSGFLSAMADAGLAVRDEDVAEGAFTYRSGMQAAEKLLSMATPPSAIFASNDDMAAGVIAMAHSKGLRIPQDLSVVGFDDTTIATAIWPQLTTIRQPIADMARRSVSLLADTVLGDGDAARRELLDIAIIERDTVAPPARG